MFVKVDDGVFVNLLHVSEIRENDERMLLRMGDGYDSIRVADEYKQSVLNRITDFKRALRRLAVGNFYKRRCKSFQNR